MKNIIYLIIGFCLVAGSAHAQYFMLDPSKEPQQLFDVNADLTGFGTFEARYTEMMGKPGVMMGARGGVVFSGHYLLGLGAYGLVSPLETPEVNANGNGLMDLGYAGLFTGVNIAPRKLFHISVPVFVGVGQAQINQKIFIESGDIGITRMIYAEKSVFLVLEPALLLEVNVTNFMKIGLGASYRMIENSDLNTDISDDDLSGFSGNLTLSFGKFL